MFYSFCCIIYLGCDYMGYVDFEKDGKIYKVSDDNNDLETDVLEEETEFDKTKELNIIDDSYMDDKTIVDIFGENNE